MLNSSVEPTQMTSFDPVHITCFKLCRTDLSACAEYNSTLPRDEGHGSIAELSDVRTNGQSECIALLKAIHMFINKEQNVITHKTKQYIVISEQ